MDKSISAAILAGGSATRLAGMTKCNIIVDGKTILSRILRCFEGIFDEIIIVSNNPAEFSYFENYKVVSDIYPGIGPLGGIHAAIKASESAAVFIVAGDMPLINKEIVHRQVEAYYKSLPDILIPSIGEYIEPLHSIYRKGIISDLENYIIMKKYNAVWRFIETLSKAEYFDPGDTDEVLNSFMSVNTFEDVARAERIIRGL